MNDRDTGVTRQQRPDDAAGLKCIGRGGDRPPRTALRLQPRRDGVAVICRDKLRAPLLGVPLALEGPLSHTIIQLPSLFNARADDPLLRPTNAGCCPAETNGRRRQDPTRGRERRAELRSAANDGVTA
jgi:hypothetical protein